jgi:hypothetical protein
MTGVARGGEKVAAKLFFFVSRMLRAEREMTKMIFNEFSDAASVAHVLSASEEKTHCGVSTRHSAFSNTAVN